MSTIGKRAIYAGPADGESRHPLYAEGIASEAILPGTVVKSTDAGISPNTEVGTDFSHLFLIADKDQMKSRSVDDIWYMDETISCIQPRSGEFINVLVAGGEVVSIGSPMTREGAEPILVVATVLDGSTDVVCYSDETVTPAETALVRMRVA